MQPYEVATVIHPILQGRKSKIKDRVHFTDTQGLINYDSSLGKPDCGEQGLTHCVIASWII